MPTDKELMQQALEALDEACEIVGKAWAWRDEKGRAAANALRARLAQPELVGKHLQFSGPMHVVCQCDQCKAQPKPYAAQAATVASQTQSRMSIDPVTGDVGIGTVKRQREWQGLTDEEIKSAASLGIYEKPLIDFARAIEAKLKEKNHGN